MSGAIFAAVLAVAAQTPEAVITGPTGGLPGDIIVLDASQSSADFYLWNVFPKLPDGRQTIAPFPGGTHAVLATVPGKYTVVLTVGTSDGLDQIEYVVTIGGDVPPVPPKPPIPPRPEPEPTFSPGRFDLAAASYKWASKVPEAERGRAAKLAAGFRAVASQIAAGVLRSAADIHTTQSAKNREALGDTADIGREWRGWLESLAVELKRHGDAGTLRKPEDYQTAWTEIATGLEAVK